MDYREGREERKEGLRQRFRRWAAHSVFFFFAFFASFTVKSFREPAACAIVAPPPG
jgi:hypothetical protein